MILAALILFATFDLSPTPNVTHGCVAWLRNMVPAICVDPRFPAETYACELIGPMVSVTCEVYGNEAHTTSRPYPGQALAFGIYAENSLGRSGYAEPILGVRP